MMPAPLVAPPNFTAESRGARFATLGRRVLSVGRRASKQRVFGLAVGRRGCSPRPSAKRWGDQAKILVACWKVPSG
jgi:hypothetical protein